MNFSPHRREEPDLNITPLIDVVFLLLIFFMVSTSFNQEAEITIDLPKASSEKKNEQDQPLLINIDATGRYYIKSKMIGEKALKSLLQRRASADKKGVKLIISADAKSPHQSVVTVMDLARQLGILHLSFATQQNKK